MVVVSILVDYLDGYLSSEWPLQVDVKLTFHETCEHEFPLDSHECTFDSHGYECKMKANKLFPLLVEKGVYLATQQRDLRMRSMERFLRRKIRFRLQLHIIILKKTTVTRKKGVSKLTK